MCERLQTVRTGHSTDPERVSTLPLTTSSMGPRTVSLIAMENRNDTKQVVMAYISALHNHRYDEALRYLEDKVRIRGPAGETFGKPMDFVEMLKNYHGKYDVKKVFTDGNEVSLWYDLDTSLGRVSMASWYQVKDGRIASIQTLFDPRAFGPPPRK